MDEIENGGGHSERRLSVVDVDDVEAKEPDLADGRPLHRKK